MEMGANGYPHMRNVKENSTFHLESVSSHAEHKENLTLQLESECDHIKATALPLLKASAVVDEATGKGVLSNFRTSYGMFLARGEKDQIVQAIEERIAVFSQVPLDNGENIQVLRYQRGQYYRLHHDFFTDQANLARGRQRVATMLMYLNDDIEGGETYFPSTGTGNCSCGGVTVKGTCIKPIKGNALLFWSMGLDGKEDYSSMHSGCAVLSGEKWSATKWLRQEVFAR